MNKLRRLAISLMEEIEEHISQCEDKPFNEENWYNLEDKVYRELEEYLIGKEE